METFSSFLLLIFGTFIVSAVIIGVANFVAAKPTNKPNKSKNNYWYSNSYEEYDDYSHHHCHTDHSDCCGHHDVGDFSD